MLPNRIVRKFLTDHKAQLVKTNDNNKHVYIHKGSFIFIPSDEMLDFFVLERLAENHFEMHHHDLDAWLGANGVKP